MKATIADIKVTRREVDVPEKCPNPKCGADLTRPCAITGWELQDQQRPCSFDGEHVTDDIDTNEAPEGGELFVSWIALHCAACSFSLAAGDHKEIDTGDRS